MHPRIRRSLSILVFGLAAGPVAAPGHAQSAAGQLVLHAFDVGQGHCSLVRCPAGRFILVDCGSDQGGDAGRIRAAVAKLTEQRPLAAVVATHPGSSHTSFIPRVLDGVRVEQVLLAGSRSDYPAAFQTWLQKVETRGAVIDILPPGYSDPAAAPRALTCGGATAHVLAANVEGENALVLRFAVRRSPKESWRLVLAGAAGPATEKAVLGRYPADFLRTDVLQLAARGGKQSSGEAWLAALRPAYAFASAGRDAHVDPDCGTLRRVEGAVQATACHTLSCGGEEAARRCKSPGTPPWCTFVTRQAVFGTIDQGDLRFVLSPQATTVGMIPARSLLCP